MRNLSQVKNSDLGKDYLNLRSGRIVFKHSLVIWGKEEDNDERTDSWSRRSSGKHYSDHAVRYSLRFHRRFLCMDVLRIRLYPVWNTSPSDCPGFPLVHGIQYWNCYPSSVRYVSRLSHRW